MPWRVSVVGEEEDSAVFSVKMKKSRVSVQCCGGRGLKKVNCKEDALLWSQRCGGRQLWGL